MIQHEKVKKILYGGDYNPEQWPEEIWQEDMRMFSLAGIDIVTLNVFNWAALQPDENTYSFEKLDKVMKLVRENGLLVCLATSTAAHPAWMARKYPDILRVDAHGRKAKFGGRHNSCPNSPTYKKYSVRLAKQIALRYKDFDNIAAWHVSNEYGGECYCENCEKAFRVWLQDKYGTIEELNKSWNTSFWGHTFYSWDDIVVPNYLSEHFGNESSMFQGMSLDYRRFNSDGILNCFKSEYDVIKEITPDIQITTNLMGFFKPLDYQKWARSMDFISWDSYPATEDPAASMALSHDLHRGLKDGMPFILMEQTPSVTNWQPYNALKRPGVMRLWSYQAVAHGADSVMFFQMRRSIGACEKYHGAVIDHVGHENTRVFREIAQLGGELKAIEDKILDARCEAKVAILVDWDNWWALEYSAGPSRDLKYIDEVKRYYSALYSMNIEADIISTETDISGYKMVIAPVLYMTKSNYAKKLETFVAAGGVFITTFFSGIVDEHDLVISGGYPGDLRELLGIWVEEIDALKPGTKNAFVYKTETYGAELLCDIIHLQGAEAISYYGSDFYEGTPVVTKNQFGSGTAYYIGTRPSLDFYETFLGDLCTELKILPVITAEGVEATRRIKDDKAYLFLLNHTDEEKEVLLDMGGCDILHHNVYQSGECIKIPSKGVVIIEQDWDKK